MEQIFEKNTLVRPLTVRPHQSGDEDNNGSDCLTNGTDTIAEGGEDLPLDDILGWDGTLEVEGNGEIEFVNKDKRVIPSLITYLQKVP